MTGEEPDVQACRLLQLSSRPCLRTGRLFFHARRKFTTVTVHIEHAPRFIVPHCPANRPTDHDNLSILTSQQSPCKLVMLSFSNISRLHGLRAHIRRDTSSSSTVTTPDTPRHRAAPMAVYPKPVHVSRTLSVVRTCEMRSSVSR